MNTSSSSSSSSVVPPGYRFYPTEEELISFFLQNKLDNRREDMEQVIPVVDVYSFDPWLLPEMSGEPCRRDGEEWFFFCPRQERETLGGKPNRTTPSGYWKATGTSSNVISSANRVLGMKRTMVFYQGRAAHGTKTHWKMNEYRAIMVDGGAASAASSSNPPPRFRNEFSLCRVYTQSGYIRSFDRRPAVVAASDAQRIVPNEEAPPPPPSTTAGDAQRIAPNEEAPPPPPPPPPLPLATAATISGTEPPGAASPAINSLSHEHSSSSDGNGASQRFARPGGQLDELQLDPGENDDDCDDDLFHLDWF